MGKEKLQAVDDVIHYIEATIVIIGRSIEYLRNGEVQRGYQLIDDICQKLGQIIDILHNIVNQDHINITEINDNIKEMFEAMENKDYVLLADIMEFELKNKLGEWNKILSNTKF